MTIGGHGGQGGPDGFGAGRCDLVGEKERHIAIDASAQSASIRGVDRLSIDILCSRSTTVHKARKSTPSKDLRDSMYTHTFSDKVLNLVGFLDGVYSSEMS